MPPTTGDFIHEVYDNREQEEESINEEDEVLVELDNIHKTYLLGIEGVPALRGVSLKIRKGEWVVVYGTSGGGKTTLLNLIGTIDKPTKGEVKPYGKNKKLLHVYTLYRWSLVINV